MSLSRQNDFTHWTKTVAVVGLLSLGACFESEPTIDTSSKAAFERSIAEVQEALPETDRERLRPALVQIMLGEHSPDGKPLAQLASLATIMRDEEALLARIQPIVDGKTGRQVIRIADERALERYMRQMAALTEEISALEMEIENASAIMRAGQQTLEEIELSGARYYWSDDSVFAEPVVDFRVTNRSDAAIRKIFVHGLLETPGRSVPWVDDSFYYEFRGGLEPGEDRHLILAINRYADWGNEDLKSRDDLVLTLTIANIEDADGKRLIAVDENEVAEKEERVRSLREKGEGLAEKVREMESRLSEDRS